MLPRERGKWSRDTFDSELFGSLEKSELMCEPISRIDSIGVVSLEDDALAEHTHDICTVVPTARDRRERERAAQTGELEHPLDELVCGQIVLRRAFTFHIARPTVRGGRSHPPTRGHDPLRSSHRAVRSDRRGPDGHEREMTLPR